MVVVVVGGCWWLWLFLFLKFFLLFDLVGDVRCLGTHGCSSAFYLTVHGKCLTQEALQHREQFDRVPLVMHGRLCGGSAVPGAWVCNAI